VTRHTGRPVAAPEVRYDYSAQKQLYRKVDQTLIPWSEENGFIGKLPDSEFVGPFDSFLFSPDVSRGFLQFQEAESKFTNLDERVRQVVILTVGALWGAKYELYAEHAVTRHARPLPC
jgi:4-carboxymuconolactone decarboxylase